MRTVWCLFDVDNEGRYLLGIYPTLQKAIRGCEANGVVVDGEYTKLEEWEVLDA